MSAGEDKGCRRTISPLQELNQLPLCSLSLLNPHTHSHQDSLFIFFTLCISLSFSLTHKHTLSLSIFVFIPLFLIQSLYLFFSLSLFISDHPSSLFLALSSPQLSHSALLFSPTLTFPPTSLPRHPSPPFLPPSSSSSHLSLSLSSSVSILLILPMSSLHQQANEGMPFKE